MRINIFDEHFRFYWEKEGEQLEVGGPRARIHYISGTGSITIQYPRASDEGVYQCFARNRFGTAVSTKTLLKMAGQALQSHRKLS
jgi:hypothetical protein